MQTFKIQAKYAPEIFIPIAAIDDNVKFMIRPDNDRHVVTTDGVDAKIVQRETINVLSDKGTELFNRLCPNMSLEAFMRAFYKRTNGLMASLEFQYMRLQK